MNKIDELIQKHCQGLPAGRQVEWKTLGELGYFYGGLSGKSKVDFSDGNAKFISYMNVYSNIAVNVGYNDFVKIKSDEKQNKIEYGDVLFTGSSETPNECGMSSVLTVKTNEPLYLNSFCFGFRLHNRQLFLPEFFKYLFRDGVTRKQIALTASGVTRFNVSKKRFAKIIIPVPPIEVQREIVKVLDNFTELSAELSAELKARQKQYTYYRDQLLTFEDNVEWKTLEQLCEIRNGYTPSTSNHKYWRNGTIPWFRMEDIRTNGRILSDSIQHITFDAIKGKGLFKANSIIIATTATIGEHALLIADSLANQRFTNLAICKSLQNKVNIKYFFYYMFKVAEWCKTHVNESGFASVDMKGFKQLLIPIPPLAEQERIVAILDKFDALTNSISEGLPYEIKLRQKQYEYYRNKLLTFPHIEAEHVSR